MDIRINGAKPRGESRIESKVGLPKKFRRQIMVATRRLGRIATGR